MMSKAHAWRPRTNEMVDGQGTRTEFVVDRAGFEPAALRDTESFRIAGDYSMPSGRSGRVVDESTTLIPG
jgi:hypothetical protein